MNDPLKTARNAELERSVLNKVTLRLSPFLAILYIFCLLDRTNVSLAALTMKHDLRFDDVVYGWGAGIFFVGYLLFEVPSNLIMEKVGARRWIFRIMITWGAISASMMFMRTPVQFYSLRFLLGLAEAGFFPGVILYYTYWIPATARAKAISRFLALTAVLGVFGGPLGGVLLGLNRWLGLAGWQWLFVLEGVPSMLLGFVVLAFLPDKPAHAGWLTPAEKQWLSARLEAETRNTECVQHFTLRQALKEPRILLMCTIFVISSTAGNAVGFFGPELIKSRSGGLWSDRGVAVSTAIPAVIGAIAMLLAATHSDRTGQRRLHVVFGYMIAAFGFVLCVYAPSAEMTVAALALNALGERIGAGSYWALTTNLLGARAAAGGIALINSIGNTGGFYGPIVMGYLKKAAGGGFALGLFTAAALMFLAASLAALLRGHPRHEAHDVDLADDLVVEVTG